MKFTDGLWLKANGVAFSGGVEVVNAVLPKKDEVELMVATRHIATRGDTLNGAMLTVNISSPCDDIVKVKLTHFKGRKPKGPNFELFPDGKPAAPTVNIENPNQSSTILPEPAPQPITFSSGSLSAKVNTSPKSYGITFSHGSQYLTSTEYKGQAVIDVPYKLTLQQASEATCVATQVDPSTGVTDEERGVGQMIRFMLNEVVLSVGESIYGFGERFGPFIKNGQQISTWNQDGGTSSQQAYKTVPFYISSKGYGLFVNHSEEVDFEVGSEKCSKVGFSVRGESLEYYVIGGGSMKAVLSNYTKLTGRPGLPPTWTFGLWMSTSFTTSYDQKTVSGFLQQMKERDCPVRVLHLDCFWMKRYDWCSFTFDPENFPDPKAYIAQVKKEYGVKVCVWINPYISQHSIMFDEGMENDYLIKRTNGDVWQWDMWQPGCAIVDFTNPAACEWYTGKLAALIDMGVDALKTDFSERIPHLGVKFFDGSDPRKMHNFYAHKYNEAVFNLLEKKLGKHEAVLFARAASAGGQRYPVHWGGDCESSYEAMAESLRGGLSLTSSGFAFWSHDIGGFEGQPPNNLFMRWLAFGLFSTHSRLHGSFSYRVPWLYGEEAVKVCSELSKLKMRLMPYIYAQGIKSHETGVPLMRSMVIEFPEDPTSAFLDKQYMLGDSLLIAPVFSDDTAQYYIPAGNWTCFWSKKVITGPKWVSESSYSFTRIPIFVRPNTILLLGPEGVTTPDYSYAEVGLEVQKYELEGGKVSVQVPTGKGVEWAGEVSAEGKGEVQSTGVKLK
ncbi:hypothetical protein FRB95_012978 [Tulasnella sp. JGI-2019a]|nr:hypothetical protein FRB95_012978 [Tulasnella sp. JGI-2019a]